MALTVTPFEVSSWSTTTTPKTITVTGALTGDKIVVIYGGDNGFSGNVSAATVTTTGGTTSSWTEPQEGLAAAGQAWLSSSVADVTADGDVTVSIARTQSTGTLWGGMALRCRDHGGIGVSARSAPSAAETVSLSVSQDSAVAVLAIDWDALSVVAFSPAGATDVERSQQGPGPDLTFYAGYWLNQAAGTRGYGIGTSSTTSLHIIAIEILAAGTAAAGGVQPARPGRTWQRRFKHRQQAPTPPTTTAAATNAAADIATVTGVAQDPTRAISTGPSTATATGAAQAPSPQISSSPGSATATGTANNATISTGSATNAAATTATGTGVANAPSPAVAPVVSAASASGAAQNTTSKVSPSPTVATGTGAANNPTIQTGSFTNAAAGVATGTGVAQQPSAKINVTPGLATATGVANNPSAGSSISAQAGLASATGTASNATVTRSTSANAGVATATGSVPAAHWSLRATANAAVAIAAAYDALIVGAQANARSAPTVTARRVGLATVEGEGDTAAVTSAGDSSALVSGRTSIPTTTSRTSSNSSVTE